MQINTSSEIQKVEEEKKEEEVKVRVDEVSEFKLGSELNPPSEVKKGGKRGRKRKEETQSHKEKDLKNIFYYSEPVRVDELWGVNQKNIVGVYAAGNYSYALELQDPG